MQCVKLLPSGAVVGKLGPSDVISVSPLVTTDDTCTSGLLLITPDELGVTDPAALGITPSAITATFTWGFGVVLLIWSIGYSVGVAKKLIAKA